MPGRPAATAAESAVLIAAPGSGRRPRGRRRAGAPRTGCACRSRATGASAWASARASVVSSSSTSSPSRRTPTAVPASSSAPASSRGRSVRTRIRIGRSSISARSSRKSPAAASRPCDMTRTCEPSRSTSSSTWLDTITQRPSLPRRRNSATRSARWRGSRPVSGSSRTSTRGVVDDRLRHLHPLSHPLRIRGQTPPVGRVEADRLECRRRGGCGIGEPVQRGRESDELACRQRLEHALLLRNEADQPGHARVRARVGAEDANGALGRPGEPAEHAEHRRLAGAVRAEERRHAGADVEADVRDGDERAEPLRDSVGDDAWLGGAQRNASIRR